MSYMIGTMRDGHFIPGGNSDDNVIWEELLPKSEYWETGRIDPLGDAVSWANKNPLAWISIVKWAHEDRSNGFNPSVRLYVCILRRPHFARKLGLSRMAGEQFLINDHLTTGLARLLNRMFPSLKVPTREASVDSWK